MSFAFHLRVRDEPQAAGLARRCIAASLGDIDEIDVDLVCLVATELVGRLAQASGGTAVDVHVDVNAARVRVHVTGQARSPVTPPERSPSAGWSLVLMERTVDRWGIDDGPATRVWFEVDRPAVGPDAPARRGSESPAR